MNSIKIDINPDFYESFLGIPCFSSKLEKRKNNIIKKYQVQELSQEDFINEYFVELFSWSVFTPDILKIIENYLQKNNLHQVIDPCSGNCFHTYLIHKYLNIPVVTIDIQQEDNPWISMIEKDGRDALRKLSFPEHQKSALLLSWIDYESLTIELLELYQGRMVISVGNYEGKSPQYLKKLNENYELQEEIILRMPWNLEEKIQIYTRY